jgi:hypothetical protein
MNWNTGGFEKKSEVSNGASKSVVVQDLINMATVPKAFYRLQVTRIPGPP